MFKSFLFLCIGPIDKHQKICITKYSGDTFLHIIVPQSMGIDYENSLQCQHYLGPFVGKGNPVSLNLMVFSSAN